MTEPSASPQFDPMYWARLDNRGRIAVCDGRWRRLTGTRTGDHWQRAFEPADRATLSNTYDWVRRRRHAAVTGARLAREPGIATNVVLLPEGRDVLVAVRRAAALLERKCQPLMWHVLDSLPVGICVTNNRGEISQCNRAARHLWQGSDTALPADPAAYRGWWTDGRPLRTEDWPAWAALAGEVVTDQPIEVETFAGERRLVLSSSAPLRDAQQRITGALLTYRDVSDLHHSQTALRESERLLRRVLETLPVGVWFTDADGRIVSGNAAGRAIWEGARYVGADGYGDYHGWWADSGKPILPEDWAVHRALRNGETTVDQLIRIETFTGRNKYITSSAAPLRDEQGHVVGAIIVNQDVTARVQAEEERSLLADIVTSTRDAVISITTDARISSWNAAAERLFGYSSREVLGKPLQLLTANDRGMNMLELFNRVLAGECLESVEVRRLHKDGSPLDLSLTASPLRNRAGQINGVCAIYRDITARKRDEETLRLWAHALASTRNGIAVLEWAADDWRIVFVNAAFEQLTGYGAEEAVGQPLVEFLGTTDPHATLEELRSAASARRSARTTVPCRRRDGSQYWAEVSLGPVREPGGEINHYVAVLDDVSDRVHYQTELAHRASHDALTGLPNRNLLRDRIQQALAQAHRDEQSMALLFIDLDGFKHVNDSLGHKAGDRLLREVGRRLQQRVRQEDTVARLGGDEFVLVLNELEQPQDAERVALEVIQALNQPFRLNRREVFIGCSIGIAAYPTDGRDDDVLMRHADAAMYRAKESGKGGFRFYSARLDQRASDRVALEAGLRRALERRELRLLFQPQRCLRTGAVVGVEALLRWEHPEWGLVRPDMFIKLAEETGLIVPIGRWVLREACAHMQRWRRERGWTFTVAVNLSARQFAHPDRLLETVHEALGTSGLEAGQLELELTETMLMRDPIQVSRTLASLKEAGIALAIDDFGIGFSSLNYLRSFPVDKLKIDRAFIRDLGGGKRPAALAASIVGLGHSLSLTMVGEGVENADQLDQLTQTGCDQVQGYLCGHPLPAQALVDYMHSRGSAEGLVPH